MHRAARLFAVLLGALALREPQVRAEGVETGAPASFTAAHGRRAAVFGYAAQGLEVWAYPLQLLNGYRLRVEEVGRVFKRENASARAASHADAIKALV